MTLACDYDPPSDVAASRRPWLISAAIAGMAALAVQSPEVREVVIGVLTVGIVWIAALIGVAAVSPPPDPFD